MKITIICDLYLPVMGGAELAVNALANEFLKKGHDVNIVASRYPIGLKEEDVIGSISVTRLYFPVPTTIKSSIMWLLFSRASLLKLKKCIDKEKPDIVNLYFAADNIFYALKAKHAMNFPLVASFQGNDVYRNPKKSGRHKEIFENLLKEADFVTASSKSLLKDIMKIDKNISEKSAVTANGINIEDFETKEKYENKNPYIFSIGRFEYKKGFDMLINAFSKIKRNDLDLIIAGTGKDWKKCESLVKSLSLENRIMLLGNISNKDKIKLYNGCEFFVLPSRLEAFGITNLEAMAAGKAVLAANTGGVAEIVNSQRGMLVEPNKNALTKGIEKMFEKNLVKMGMNGKMFVKKNYTWEHVSEKYLEIFKKVAQ